MDALARRLRQTQQTLGAEARGLGIAPDGMAGRVARHLMGDPRFQARLVLGMEGGAA